MALYSFQGGYPAPLPETSRRVRLAGLTDAQLATFGFTPAADPPAVNPGYQILLWTGSAWSVRDKPRAELKTQKLADLAKERQQRQATASAAIAAVGALEAFVAALMVEEAKKASAINALGTAAAVQAYDVAAGWPDPHAADSQADRKALRARRVAVAKRDAERAMEKGNTTDAVNLLIDLQE